MDGPIGPGMLTYITIKIMILPIDVVDPLWVPEPLSQVCLCIGYVVTVAKINGSLQMEKVCIENSGVCVCVSARVGGFLVDVCGHM